MATTATIVRTRTPAQAHFRRWLARRPLDDLNHYELLDGRIVMAPPAGWPHAGIEVTIASRIQDHVAARGLGIVQGASAGYDLPSGDTVEPDARSVTVYGLRRRTYDRGTTVTAGHVPSRVLPDLRIDVADVFAGTD